MARVGFYFRLHQPMRLHPERDKFIWEEMDREIFCGMAEACYIPVLHLFVRLTSECLKFKLILGISGTFLEQADRYHPEVIRLLQDLLDAGGEDRVE
ncbi:MAG TPA: hypothetical protein VII99_11995, partial [Bacteroidia bacterium]